jgi:short-subunit dehydrogenase
MHRCLKHQKRRGKVAETALITGASYGIGRELAILCARDGLDLVLVARSKDRLTELEEELRNRYTVSTRVSCLDLTEPDAPQRLYQEVTQEGMEIGVLINNAGYGFAGAFAEGETNMQLDMVQLNVTALTLLTRLFVPSMLSRGRGRILNLASTASFQPGPYMAVYYATKAYVLSFSEALSEEVRKDGVTVTALCPGPTATAFQSRAKMEGSRLWRLGVMDAKTVAEKGYRGMMAGRTIVVTGLANRLLVQSVRFSPRFLVRRVAKWLNQSSDVSHQSSENRGPNNSEGSDGS